MSGLSKISIQVNANIRDLARLRAEYDKTSKAQSNFSQGFLSSFGIHRGEGIGSLIGSATGNLLQSGAQMLFGHVTDAIKRGMEMKDLIEQQKIAFTNLTGSEKEAISHMRDMFNLARDTPFKTRELLLYSQQLQAVGVGYRDVRQELTDLGDAMAKAGTFDRMDKAILAITQMRSKGRITGEELNQQLAEALPGARGYLARGLGVSQPQLNEYLSENRLNIEPALKLMFMQMRLDAGGTMKRTATKTEMGLRSTLEDVKDLLYAEAAAGGDPFDTSGGAYAQNLKNINTLIHQVYGGPQAKQIAAKVGLGAQAYYGVLGWGEENAFNASALSPALMLAQKLAPLDSAKQLGSTIGQYLPDGMKQSLQSAGASIKGVAQKILGEDIWNALSTFWETQSPSKKTIRMGEWIREGLEMGLNKKQAGNYANLQKLSQQTPDFMRKLGEVAGRLGTDPDYLLNVFARESSLNPMAYNPSGATGLFQLMPMHARKLGLPGGPNNKAAFREAVQSRGALGQLDLFYRYITEIVGVDSFKDQASAYASVFMPKYVNSSPDTVIARRGTRNYGPNAGLDRNRDGSITKRELGLEAEGALGAGKFFSVNGQLAVTKSNPMPVEVVASGPSIYVNPGYNDPGLSNQIGSARNAYAARRSFAGAGAGSAGPQILNDPVPVMVDVAATLQPLSKGFEDIYKTTSIMPKPLIDANKALKEHSDILDEMARLRLDAIKEPTNKKKDKLFGPTFTRFGVAEDFHGGLTSLLGNMGWEKPTSLLKEFGIGMLRNLQGRMAQDVSSLITGSIFGTRDQGGVMGGGLFDKLLGRSWGNFNPGYPGSPGKSGGGFGFGSIFGGIGNFFGKLFGGFRASGGGMQAGRFYVAGENGPEIVTGPGYVHNNRDSRSMMGGGYDPSYTIVAIGDREVGRALDAYRSTSRGRRAKMIQGKYGRKIMAHA